MEQPITQQAAQPKNGKRDYLRYGVVPRDTVEGAPAKSWPFIGKEYANQDGSTTLVLSENGSLRVFDPETGEVITARRIVFKAPKDDR